MSYLHLRNILGMPALTGNAGEALSVNGTEDGFVFTPFPVGTVTDFIFTDANGFDGTVSTSTSTPTLSLTTTVANTQVMFSNSGAITGDAGMTYSSGTDTLTLVGDVIVADDPYDATGWNGNFEVPTKNAIRDKIESLAAGSGHVIQEEGTPLTNRANLNFIGTGITAADDAGNNATTVTLSIMSNGGDNRVVTSLGASNLLNGEANFTFDGSLATILAAGLGVTQDDTKGLVLLNSTAAAAGAQQISPAIRWEGQGWKTDATAASQSVEYRAYVLPVEGTANPSANWLLQSSINGAAYNTLMTVKSSGEITFNGVAEPLHFVTMMTQNGNGAGTYVTIGGDANYAGVVMSNVNIGNKLKLENSQWGNSLIGTGVKDFYIYTGADASFNSGTVIAWADATNLSWNLGLGGTNSGILKQSGATSGTITFQVQNVAGTYNMNWPTTAGTSGYLLTSGGGGATAMTWTDPSTLGGGGYSIIDVDTTPYSLTPTSGEHVLLCDTDAAGSAITVNLPTAVGNTAKFHIKNMNTGAGTITVDGNGTETIDGGTTAVLAEGKQDSITIVSDNVQWWII